MMKRSVISKLLTFSRIKRICHGLVSDHQYMLTARPQQAVPPDVTNDPVCRLNRLSAIIEIYSIPEARSLNFL
ncbi:hypothetical protein KGM_205234 [Danaus plexippus plexippus]|uniref:Uncharacterized protein n=1 Tax=Danaus plexippus plexippus TaxID=278856 RepID=A0A212ER12_DANPL|nr:hypothetical protein KGM_205234 [Danaus plexippus plexippus]